MSLNPLFVQPLTYVLETRPIEGKKYTGRYIGSTMNLCQRWAQHKQGYGSKFCKQNPPLGFASVHVPPTDERAAGVMAYENTLTLQTMRDYIKKHGSDGWRSVRGGDYCALSLQRPVALGPDPVRRTSA